MSGEKFTRLRVAEAVSESQWQNMYHTKEIQQSLFLAAKSSIEISIEFSSFNQPLSIMSGTTLHLRSECKNPMA